MLFEPLCCDGEMTWMAVAVRCCKCDVGCSGVMGWFVWLMRLPNRDSWARRCQIGIGDCKNTVRDGGSM